MRYVFIINPKAGKGGAEKDLIPLINEYFAKSGGNYDIYVTERVGEATEIARNQAKMGDEVRIYACGGDGTVCETLNGIVGFNNVELGNIPCGSANDFIKYFGDRDDFTNIKYQVMGTGFPVDIIKSGDSYALNQCSAGMDAMVAENMGKFKNIRGISGSMAYNIAIVYTLFKKFGMKMQILIDGKPLDSSECLFAVCANGPYYGGGYMSAPYAVPSDGCLDYSIITTKSRIKVVSVLGQYKKGQHVGKKYCKYGNCQSMEFRSEKEIPINLDGEIIRVKNINFEIVKRGVKWIVPSIIAERFDNKVEETRQERLLAKSIPVCGDMNN